MEETEITKFNGIIIRGDNFKFNFFANIVGTNILHTFEQGDVLKAALKTSINNQKYELYKKITLEEDMQIVPFNFTHEETINLPVSDEAILEVEWTDIAGEVHTIYQRDVEIKGDVIDE